MGSQSGLFEAARPPAIGGYHEVIVRRKEGGMYLVLHMYDVS